jgi:signal transduction histidine kinase
MSVPASHDQQPPQQDALRSADLSELLGHVHTCWDNERRSLSRQLHDSLGSSLTALTMHLGLLMQKLPPDPALQDRAGHMKKLLGQIVETNRQMQLKLWNDKLEFLGVRVALDELVTQFGEQRGITRAAACRTTNWTARAATASCCCIRWKKRCATSSRTRRPPKSTSSSTTTKTKSC